MTALHLEKERRLGLRNKLFSQNWALACCCVISYLSDFIEKTSGNYHSQMSFEACGSEILGDLVPNFPTILALSNKLDLNKLFGSGGSHPIVLRVLEQNSRSHSLYVQPLCYKCLFCPNPLLVCCLSRWYSVLVLTSVLVHV